MRKIYMIRHGKPDFPGGKHMCLGRTDIPLGEVGRMQAELLAVDISSKVSHVYSSPLKRAVQTAEPLGLPILTIPSLAEQYAGEWDGLTFDEIRARYPELYALRATERIALPGSEPDPDALSRFNLALSEIFSSSKNNVAVVTHSSVMRLWLESRGEGYIKVPYGSYVEICGGNIEKVGSVPHPQMNAALSLKLLKAARVPQRVVLHCQAVAATASEIAQRLGMDVNLAECAALLHDIARIYPNHPQVGASWLDELGYPTIAEIIRQHHDHTGEHLDVSAIVYLADKLVIEDKPCTLAERFEASHSKCVSLEQKALHAKRFKAAENIIEMIKRGGIDI